MILFYSLIFLLGLIFGSFITSLSYRILRGEALPKGRSYCPRCKNMIHWYDNIPLISYFFLRGKCRTCKKPISFRYPLIEGTTGILFLIFSYSMFSCTSSLLCVVGPTIDIWKVTLFFLLLIISVSIVITDLEAFLIPDELSYSLLTVAFLYLISYGGDIFWRSMFVGFVSSLFFLTLYAITNGKGMGLGDAKIAIGIGMILGWPFAVTWLLVSFVVGALVGLALLAFGKAQLKMAIPFGPFLIVSFFMVLLWGRELTRLVMPYITL